MTAAATTATATGVTLERLSNLRRWNFGLTVLHLAQAVLMLALTNDFAIGVICRFPMGHRGRRASQPRPSSTCGSGGPSRSSWASRAWIIY